MEAVANAIMSLVIPMLSEMIKDEYNLDNHLKRHVKSLRQELMMVQAALSKVAKVPRDQLDAQIKPSTGEVRKLL